jgi:NAD(P)H-dependent FMN reductase
VAAVLILAVCGSLQQKSGNLTLLERAAVLAPEGVQVSLFEGLCDLPLFNPDLERDGELLAVAGLRRAIASSDALLIACPEYGHSLPGALKNAIDWLIGTGELERKVVGVTAAVAIQDRGRLGLQALQQTLRAVSARIVGGEPTVRGPQFDRDVLALLELVIAEARLPDRPPAAEFF